MHSHNDGAPSGAAHILTSSPLPSPASEEQRAVASLLDEELAAIQLLRANGRVSQAWKSLDERGTAQDLVRQQYTGRYPFELLQNANDAVADDPSPRRVAFVLTDTALLVANSGRPFGAEELRAICSLGRSSKDPRKTIGYKGLGFKAVGEITASPQVFSPPLLFGFDAETAARLVINVAGPMPVSQHLPVYAFPLPLTLPDAGSDEAAVRSLLADGYVTVMRLPLREDVSHEEVAAHLRAVLRPELLLLLDATDALVLRGSGDDFDAICQASPTEREDAPALVSLRVNQSEHRWLVFRRRHSIEDGDMLRGLGSGWAQVRTVGTVVAIPVDNEDRIAVGPPRPLHVYFPLEDSAGSAALLHGDFALELDRRHIARTPEASSYNTWLRDRLAEHAAAAAGQLARSRPGDQAVVDVFAPHAPLRGAGEDLRLAMDQHLGTTSFVPCRDGRAYAPHEAAMLPPSLIGEASAAILLTLPEEPRICALPPRHQDSSWLAALGATSIRDTDAVRWLRTPPAEEVEDFYQHLVSWADGATSRSAFERALGTARCVRLTDGGWASPASGVFFPRERDEPDLPTTLPIKLAHIPKQPRIHQLLEVAGVRRFRWRELLIEHILPLLTSRETPAPLRAQAHAALNAYFQSDPRGDQEILHRVGDVLLTATTATRRAEELMPARSLYFPIEWTGNDRLERLYGPFGRVEFLEAPQPTGDEDARLDANTPASFWFERGYLQWLGVRSLPRLDTALAERHAWRLQHLAAHPHAQAQPAAWNGWLADEVEPVRDCGQHHPESQQLSRSSTIDRLPELLADANADRLLLLARVLAENWAHFSTGLQAEVICVHGSHRGGSPRRIPSLMAHLLRTGSWLPAVTEAAPRLHRPSDVWRPTPVMNRGLVGVLPLLPPTLDKRQHIQCWLDLGVIDAARPRPQDLIELLFRLSNYGTPGSEAPAQWGGLACHKRGGPEDAARWAMQQLNDSLARGAAVENEETLQSVPLLATQHGTLSFVARPFVCDDAMLAETWRDEVPILADRGLSTLIARLGLRRLEKEVEVSPEAIAPLPQRSESLEQALRQAAPFLATAAMEHAPGSRDNLIRWLPRLEVVACTQLSLHYRLDKLDRHREDATTYVAERVDNTGRPRRLGVVYLEVPRGGDPDWFALGPQLADYLGVPSQRDAFALLLRFGDAERRDYLRSRGIADTVLEGVAAELQTELHAPARDAWDDLVREAQRSAITDEAGLADEPRGLEPQSASATDGEHQLASSTSGADPEQGPSTVVSESAPVSEPPPLSAEVVEIEEGPTQPVIAVTTPSRTRPSTGTGPSMDWDRVAATNRATGQRGEMWVYQQERARVAAAGGDPDQVCWQSQLNETSNYDIRSLDDDGHPLYIEVKASSGDDLGAAIELSNAELALGIEYRHRYAIYRVLDCLSPTPRIVRFRDPIGRVLDGHAVLRIGTAKLILSPAESTRSQPT